MKRDPPHPKPPNPLRVALHRCEARLEQLAYEQVQRAPRHQLHRVVTAVVRFAEVKDRNDVVVLEIGRGPGFSFEPCQGRWVCLPHCSGKDLERDFTTKRHLRSPVDDAHPAVAEHAANLVAGDLGELVRCRRKGND